jgi:hypothetical protein
LHKNLAEEKLKVSDCHPKTLLTLFFLRKNICSNLNFIVENNNVMGSIMSNSIVEDLKEIMIVEERF